MILQVDPGTIGQSLHLLIGLLFILVFRIAIGPVHLGQPVSVRRSRLVVHSGEQI